jgi:tetratricopeptide (TPR) repeat protein
MKHRRVAWALPIALAVAAGCAGSHGGGPAGSPAGLPAEATPRGLVSYADSALSSGDAELARRALSRAASLAPDSAVVWVGYGRYYTATLRYKDAKESLDRAAALDPESAEPPYYLGAAYLKAGETGPALAEFQRALRLEPGYAPALAAIGPLLEERYVAAGIPGAYASFPGRASLSRGELGVALAVELGVDPGRPSWRSGTADVAESEEVQGAWGANWLRASVERGWIAPYPDGRFHLDDPVTRGTLAILLSQLSVQAHQANDARPFPDLGSSNYLDLPASRAVAMGLPTRQEGRFEAQALATGQETLLALRGLARTLGATPVVSFEPR